MMEHIMAWLKNLGDGPVVAGIAGIVSTVAGGGWWLSRLETRVNGLEKDADCAESQLARVEGKVDKIYDHLINQKK